LICAIIGKFSVALPESLEGISEVINNNAGLEEKIDKVMQEIREEVAERRRKGYRYVPLHISEITLGGAEEMSAADLSSVRSAVASAETNADIGSGVTPMLRFSGLVRKLALLAGKAVLFISSFITDRQREFNKSVVLALKGIVGSLDSQAARQSELQSVRAELTAAIERSLREKEARIAGLEKTVAELTAAVTSQGKVKRPQDGNRL
jgi:hypothetical protein